jgi:hypothetical protein
MVPGVSTIARRRLNRKAAVDRGRDAIVIGEYERAFYGNQYAYPVVRRRGTPDRKSAANK